MTDLARPAQPARPGDLPTGPAARRRPGGRRLLPLGLLAALLLVAVLAVVSLAVGARPVAPAVTLDALRHVDPTNMDHLAVASRVPRTVLGLLVGGALGLAGAVMQGVARNPLADPGILGVNAGAAFVVVLAIAAGVTSPSGYIWFAFLGAAVAAAVVYGIAAAGREGATPVKLALAGAAVSAALLSLITGVLLTSAETLDTFRFWQVGSVAGRGADVVGQVLPFLLAGMVLALVSGRVLNALSLGDDVARGLGQRVGAARLLAAASVVVLCGAATAAAGPIAFVGLTVPHIARSVTGPDYRWVLPYSTVLGAALLLTADVLGRIVARPGEIGVGIVTAVIGAPVFIALVRRRRLAEL